MYQAESSDLCFEKAHVGFSFPTELPFCHWIESLKIGMGASG